MKFNVLKRYLIALVTLLLIASCTKDEETVTIEKLLTQHTWKADQIRSQFSSGSYEFYKRGQGNNSKNYDSDSLQLNLDNTGVYYYQGQSFNLTWGFSNNQKDKLDLTISFPNGNELLSWENISVSSAELKYAQFPKSGNSYLSSCIRVKN